MEKTKHLSIENSANLSNETFKEIFYKMWEIRFFDEKVDELFARGLIHGTTHLAVGQEATAAGSSAVLKKTDWITSTHRGHGHTLAKGTNVNEMMAELFGRTTGTNKGKGGSMHIADLDTGNLGANGIVGGGFPIAVGAALTSKMKKDETSRFVIRGRWVYQRRKFSRSSQFGFDLGSTGSLFY